MLAFVIFAVTFLVVLLALIIWLYPGSRKITTIPGLDPSDPKHGNLGDISRAGSLHEFVKGLHDEHGPIVSFWYGQTFTVSIASPELFKEHAKVFDRPPVLFKPFEPILTDKSIQYCNGAEGRKRRKLYDTAYSHEVISQQYMSIFQRIADDLVKKWVTLPKEQHVPLSENMFVFAIKAITEAAFGNFFKDEKEVSALHKAYDMIWKEMENMPGDISESHSPGMKHLEESKEMLHNQIRKSVEAAKNQGEANRVLFIEKLYEYSNSTVLADGVTFFIGGFHTTGLLLTWCIYYLGMNPEVQERCYQELVDVLGDETVTAEITNELVYLRQVLDETMRCSVMAPYAARFQEIDTELGGHKIPSGTPVLHSLGVVLQDEKLWPDPQKFDPDRFSPENRKQLKPYAFEPFGFAGRRKCPGYRFSYTEATVFMSTLLRKFRFKLVPGQVVKKEFGLVTHPKEEIWVTLEKR